MRQFPVIIFLFGLLSCDLMGVDSSSPDEQLSKETITVSELTETLVASTTVRITRFIEDGRDETSRFEGFEFKFTADGTVLASSASQEISGTYRVFRDDGKTELAMTFPSNSALYELTDDWYFRVKTEQDIQFDDSGDQLTLAY
jgi:hypothetical protein